MYIATTATKKILALKKRIKIIQGGASAGKTIGIIQKIIDKSQSIPNNHTSIVAESLPHLKKGAMRDFFSVLKAHGYYRENQHNKTDHVYTFRNGSFVEFFGLEDASKARGPRRDDLFINEANNVPYEVFDQLQIRTRGEVIIDYNPVNEFWVHEEVIPHMEHDFIILTYHDNEGLEESIIKTMEAHKHNTNWWRVFGEGQVGIKQGQVYTDWIPLNAIPEEAMMVRRGLDFGYTNDPTTVVDIYKWNGGFIIDERLYETGLKNQEIGKKLKGYDEQVGTRILVVADSSEPKSIDEVKTCGVNIIGAIKGPDSVVFGIQLLQGAKIYYTTTSHNVRREKDNYMWKIDKTTGKPLNVPEDEFNHTLDGARYAIVDIMGIATSEKYNTKRLP